LVQEDEKIVGLVKHLDIQLIQQSESDAKWDHYFNMFMDMLQRCVTLESITSTPVASFNRRKNKEGGNLEFICDTEYLDELR
jgi:hypothetical protein